MSIILFANGNLPSSEIKINPGSRIIAADGGARHCLSLGLIPQAVIGDFDSLTISEINDLEKLGSELFRYPEDKDETDLELALNYILTIGADQVKCYGLLGGRWDMSISNILLLASTKYQGIRFHIIDEGVEMFIVRGGETLKIEGNPGETVSVLPLGTDASNLRYHGMVWSLENEPLEFGSPRGVSNQLNAHLARIELGSGRILVIHMINKPVEQV